MFYSHSPAMDPTYGFIDVVTGVVDQVWREPMAQDRRTWSVVVGAERRTSPSELKTCPNSTCPNTKPEDMKTCEKKQGNGLRNKCGVQFHLQDLAAGYYGDHGWTAMGE
jgi:hypothetical protein